MNMVLCTKNHYYDKDSHEQCPFCAGAGDSWATVPLVSGVDDGVGKTEVMQQPSVQYSSAASDEGKTVIDIKKRLGSDPVVGWLVCVEGKDRGKDYKVHADNNFIGRGDDMDISIHGDDTISRSNHAIITYDTRANEFYFTQGGGRGVVRLNGKMLLTTMVVNAYDRIEIGNTKLVFAPLCGEGFNWDDEI